MYVALVNTNMIRPPIGPIGLDYIAEALYAAGQQVEILDLCWTDDPPSAVDRFFHGKDYGLVGVTLRNTDDCAFTSRKSFLVEFSGIIDSIRRHTSAPIVIGGVGFSVMPEIVLNLCNADAGITGDGEFAFIELAKRIEERRDWSDVPNLIHRIDGVWRRNPVAERPLSGLPLMTRRFIDNRRYFVEGGQAGIETKRGCPCLCTYCADPIAKGRNLRIRPPHALCYEIESLLEQGIDHLHTCDSEFNLDESHTLEVCKEMNLRRLGGKLRWYAYCSPAPFSEELARQMRKAGCVGINFGADSGDEGMLKRLRRGFTVDDIINAARFCKREEIAVMFDLLLGPPGETEESITRTIDLMKYIKPERVGVTVGVRVYPGTQLANAIFHGQKNEMGLDGNGLDTPLFFIEPRLENIVFKLLDTLIGDDERFLFFDPSRPDRNYNYNANQRLVDAIKKGYRGAYWDILRLTSGVLF